MPAGDYNTYNHDDTLTTPTGHHNPAYDPYSGDQSAASILRSVEEQQVQFERLTRELEAERESVANQLDKCKLGSDTASMNSMSMNDDSYHWRSPAHNDHDHSRLDDDSDLHTPKIESSLLLDSCLRELEDRGTMNFDNMDYVPDENYHGMNPAYVSGMMNGGNPPYDRHNEGSPHSSRLSVQSTGSNRPGELRHAQKMNNIRGRGSVSSQDPQTDNYMSYNAINRNFDSPSPHGGHRTGGPATPTRFNTHADMGLGSPHSYSNHAYSSNYYPVDPPLEPHDNHGSFSPHHMYSDHLSPREVGYPGSRGSYQDGSDRGTPTLRDPSGYPRDPRMDPEPRYGDPAPYDGYDENIPRREPNYRDSPGLDDGYRGGPPREGEPYDGHPDDRYDHYDYPPPPNGQLREPPVDDRYNDYHPDDPRADPNYDDRYNGPPPDDRYNGPPPDDRYNGPPPDDRYNGPPLDDRYAGSPVDDRYGPPHPDDHYDGPPPDDGFEPHPADRYRDDQYRDSPSQFRDGPREPAYDDGYQGPHPDDGYQGPHPDDGYQGPHPDDGYQGPHPDDRPDHFPPGEQFVDGPLEGYREEERLRQAPLESDRYGDDRYEGLPPVQHDPFADSPFHEGGPQDPERYLAPAEDPYSRRTPSPAAGSDIYGYGDGPRYGQEAPPLDPRHGHGPYEVDIRPQSYDELDKPHYDDDPRVSAPHNLSVEEDEHGRFRNPDLQEVIELLRNPNDEVKANAAAFLQHLCYMDNDMKAKTRSMDGIPPLVQLLSNDFPEVHKSACGALKNLSYGKENDLCKKAIRNCGGIPNLVRLLRRPLDDEVKDLVSGVLWNMSSSDELKKPIIDEALAVLVNIVIIPHAGWDRRLPPASQKVPENVKWTTELRNATGVLRNVSSAGFEARKKLRECEGLVDSIVLLLKAALTQNVYDNKCVENSLCIFRNLSFRCQEVADPDFHKKRATLRRQQQTVDKGEPSGCFGGGGNKKKKNPVKHTVSTPDIMSQGDHSGLMAPRRGMEQIWHPDIVPVYKTLMMESSNPVTLEAVAGTIQNIAACDWMPSVEFRATIRRVKALPVIVDLLQVESDRVVCAAGIALRNLAVDEKNKELVGKYAMPRLVAMLPPPGSKVTPPDDIICAILATMYEVIKDHADFALYLFREQGVPRLNEIAQSRHRYLARTIKFASSVLRTMWNCGDLQVTFKREGLTDRDFLTVSTMARPENSGQPSSNVNTPYNTLSRPISNQGYDDTTLSSPYSISKANHQANHQAHHNNKIESSGMIGYSNPAHMHTPDADRYGNRDRPDHRKQEQSIPMRDFASGYAAVEEPPNYNDYKRTKPPVGGVALFPNLEPSASIPPQDEHREPLYAQVNKSGRRRPEDPVPQQLTLENSGGQGGADSWV